MLRSQVIASKRAFQARASEDEKKSRREITEEERSRSRRLLDVMQRHIMSTSTPISERVADEEQEREAKRRALAAKLLAERSRVQSEDLTELCKQLSKEKTKRDAMQERNFCRTRTTPSLFYRPASPE